MNAAVFILAGSFLTAGISMMVPSGVPGAAGTAPISVGELESAHTDLKKVTIDVRDATIGDLVGAISTHAGKPVVVHWEELDAINATRETGLNIDSGPIGVTLALSILQERWERDMHDSVALLDLGDHIEIGSRSQFDHRTRERRVYDLMGFVPSQGFSEGRSSRGQGSSARTGTVTDIRDLLMTHVSSDSWDEMGGAAASSSVFGSSLIVTAPTRMHEEIARLLGDLETQNVVRQEDQRRAYENRVVQLREEYERVRQSYARAQGRLVEINKKTRGWGGDPVELSEEESRAIFNEKQSLEAESIDLYDRSEYLRNALMVLEYEPLIEH